MKDQDEILRKAAIQWLEANDPNGVYNDDEVEAEGFEPMNLFAALETVMNEMDQ